MMASHAAYRLRRAKSAPSVHKRRQAPPLPPGPLDPEIARRQATTAASRAMAQASQKSSHSLRATVTLPAQDDVSASAGLRGHHDSDAQFPDIKERLSSQTLTPGISTSTSIIDGRLSEREGQLERSAIREFQGFGDDECSAPSSYRRLRKARSMFSTRHRGSAVSSKAPQKSPTWRQFDGQGIEVENHRSLRHSISFFDKGSQSSPGLRRIKSQNAVQVNRNQLLEDRFDQTTPPQRRASLLSRKHRQDQKHFKTTVRTSRNLSPDNDIQPVRKRSNGSGLHMKARALSITIKKGLKRVFGRPEFTETVESEPQPAVSPSTVGDPTPQRSNENYGNLPPILRSMRSSDSISTTTSRVTSWTDSTAGNTVKTRQEADRNRLSVIEETVDSDRRYSDSAGDSRETAESAGHFGQVSAVHSLTRPIDSQRVYSALMRRIQETAAQDGERVISTGTVQGTGIIPERASSVQSCSDNRSVRQVASDMSMKTAQTSLPLESPTQNFQPHQPFYPQYRSEQYCVSPYYLRQRRQLPSVTRSRTSLREPESTFFPTTAFNKPKTPSPYRVAMNSVRESETHSGDDTTSVIMIKPGNTDSVPNSPSVYSRSPGGHSPSRENLRFDFETFEPTQPGMATIFNAPGGYESSKTKLTSGADTGIEPSTEWKRWMQCQMGHIGSPHSTRRKEASATKGHHRESEELDGEPLDLTATDMILRATSGGDRQNTLRRNENANMSRNTTARSPWTDLSIPRRSNFSRPMSRQSMASVKAGARPPVEHSSQRHIHQDGDSTTSVRRPYQPHIHETPRLSSETDPFYTAREKQSVESLRSPTSRMSLRATREARLKRSPMSRNPTRQVTDQGDARAVQFRSIRAVPDDGRRNNENGPSPREKYDFENTDMYSQLHGLHSTIDTKKMVELFLDSRRKHQGSSDMDRIPGSSFI